MQAFFLHTPLVQSNLLKDWAGILSADIQIRPLPENAKDGLSEATLFFVPEPMKLRQQYYFVTDLWQRYFAYHQPEVKVIGFGYHQEEDNNYLNLFELPADGASILSKFMEADKNIIFRKGKGENIRNRIKKFFEGHGDQSVTDELDKVLRIIQMAHDEMKIHQESYDFIHRELFMPNALSAKWELIKNRWSFYRPYFESTPFYQEIEALWNLLQKLSPFFDGNCEEELLFWDLDCIHCLKNLKTGLSEIEKIYVG